MAPRVLKIPRVTRPPLHRQAWLFQKDPGSSVPFHVADWALALATMNLRPMSQARWSEPCPATLPPVSGLAGLICKTNPAVALAHELLQPREAPEDQSPTLRVSVLGGEKAIIGPQVASELKPQRASDGQKAGDTRWEGPCLGSQMHEAQPWLPGAAFGTTSGPGPGKVMPICLNSKPCLLPPSLPQCVAHLTRAPNTMGCSSCAGPQDRHKGMWGTQHPICPQHPVRGWAWRLAAA